ncbi:Ig-like domain-containing protein [Bacillus zanthoxyli]|nr:Ig-like domain-containing protein [Bacillus zanthoxyli]
MKRIYMKRKKKRLMAILAAAFVAFILFPTRFASAESIITLAPNETIEILGDGIVTVSDVHDFVRYKGNTPEEYYANYYATRHKVMDNDERMVIQNTSGVTETVSIYSQPYKKVDHPALKKESMKNGESLEYTGGSDFAIPDSYESAYYRKDGTAYAYNPSQYHDHVSTFESTEISRAVITMKDDQIIYGPYDTFKMPKRSKTPAIKRVDVKKGDSWEYTGDSDFEIPGHYESAYYKEDGTAYTYYDSRFNDRFTKFLPGFSDEVKRAVLTMSEDQVIYGAYETFKVPKQSKFPALRKVSVKKGDSWSYSGGSEFIIPSHYQSVYYKEDGTASSYNKSDYSHRINELSTDGATRAVFTMMEDQDVYGPYETFKVPEQSKSPALKEINLKKGQTIEFKGDTDFTVPYEFQKASYKSDGTANFYTEGGYSERFNKFSSNEVKRTVITVKRDQTIYGPYETFNIPEVIETPALKEIAVKKGENLEYDTKSDFIIPEGFTIASYKEDGTADFYSNWNYGEEVRKLPSKEAKKSVVTILSDQVIYGPYDTFNEPKRVQNPAIATIVMEPGDFLYFEDPKSAFTVPNQHEYTWYSSNGNEEKGISNSKANYVVDGGKKLYIKNTTTERQEIYGPYELLHVALLNVNGITDEDTVITGTTVNGASISIKVGTNVIAKGTAGSDGNFKINIPKQKANTILTAEVKPSNGNNSLSKQITVKLTPKVPNQPKVNEVSDNSTVISGTAEQNTVIDVKTSTTKIASGKTDSKGIFNVSVPKQKAGTQLLITARNSVGESPIATTVVKDKTAPTPPKVNAITDQDTILTGMAEAGATVSANVGTKGIGSSVADKTGKFSIEISKQKAATKIGVTAKDAAGNSSQAVYTTVTVKPKAPIAPKVNAVADNNTLVTGTAETNTFVYIKVGTTIIGNGKTDVKGIFSVVIPKQKAGTKILVTVKNTGGYSPYTTSVVLDKTPPTPPKVNDITDQQTVVTGTAELNSTVFIKVGTRVLANGKVDKNGKFSIKIIKQKAGTKVLITAKDAAGNVGTATLKTVQDKTPPAAPSVNKVTSQTTIVTGTSEVNAKVTIKVGKAIIGNGSADKIGKFKVTIPKQKTGTKLSVTAKDVANNESPVRSVTVVK